MLTLSLRRSRGRLRHILLLALIATLWIPRLAAAGQAPGTNAPPKEYYVAVDGKAENAGTQQAPWDLASALNGKQKIPAGATLWIGQGTYICPDRKGQGFEVRLAGAPGAPILVRGAAGKRVTIDGGLYVRPPAKYLWIRDLEIISSGGKRVSAQNGSWPSDLDRPAGGLTVATNEAGVCGCRYINLVIHDGNSGVSWWSGDIDSELYGCLIYDNGWTASDRAHGHAIYTQNGEGTKAIADNIMSVPHPDGQELVQAYGTEAVWVNNYVLEGNVFDGRGWCLLGGAHPPQNCKLIGNYFTGGAGLSFGYTWTAEKEYGKGDVARDNVFFNGRIELHHIAGGVMEGNLFVNSPINAKEESDGMAIGQNRTATVEEMAKGAPLIALRPNRYDADRAHLIIFNWAKAASVDVMAASFLKDGEAYVLKDPKHFYDAPVHTGVCQNGKISVPLNGADFAVFVMLRNGSGQ